MSETTGGSALPPRQRLRAGVLWVIESAAVLLLITLVTLVLANSMSRYLMSAPLVWTEEVVKALLMWLGALGITVAALRGGLISCGIWSGKLAPVLQSRLRIFHNLIGIIVMGVLGWLASKYILLFGGDLSPILGIPKGVAISGIIGCAAGLILAFVIDLIAPEVPSC